MRAKPSVWFTLPQQVQVASVDRLWRKILGRILCRLGGLGCRFITAKCLILL
jgi:hypothetical protein